VEPAKVKVQGTKEELQYESGRVMD